MDSDNSDKKSILDEVMSSQKEEDLGNFDPSGSVILILKSLNTRESDVLSKRFNLDGKKKYTLEEIGNIYNITRERVRQIEASALKNIIENEAIKNLDPTVKYIASHLERYGKIMEEGMLLDTLISEYELQDQDKHYVPFILTISDEFRELPETDKNRKAWSLKGISLDDAFEVIDQFSEILKSQNKPISHEEALQLIEKTKVFIDRADLNHDGVVSYLELSKYLKRNPFGEWGLNEWSAIMPRGVKDKAYLVVSKHGKPVHFRDIASLIDKAGFDNKTAHPQTVHNELIKDERFVLVGRGIYALKEWGYSAGTVADVIKTILEKADHSMTKEELVEAVLQERVVKKNTIVLSLQNKSRFARTDDGKYSLV